MGTNKQQITVRVSQDIYEIINNLAKEKGISKNMIAAELVVKGMEVEKYMKDRMGEIYEEMLKREVSANSRAKSSPLSVIDSEG